MEYNDVPKNIVLINGKKYRFILEEISEETENLLSIRDVCAQYGIPRTKIYNMLRLGKFPEDVVIKRDGSATKFNACAFDKYFNEFMR